VSGALIDVIGDVPSIPLQFITIRYFCNNFIWWWFYPTPSNGWRYEKTPQRPSSQVISNGLDQLLKKWYSQKWHS